MDGVYLYTNSQRTRRADKSALSISDRGHFEGILHNRGDDHWRCIGSRKVCVEATTSPVHAELKESTRDHGHGHDAEDETDNGVGVRSIIPLTFASHLIDNDWSRRRVRIVAVVPTAIRWL